MIAFLYVRVSRDRTRDRTIIFNGTSDNDRTERDVGLQSNRNRRISEMRFLPPTTNLISVGNAKLLLAVLWPGLQIRSDLLETKNIYRPDHPHYWSSISGVGVLKGDVVPGEKILRGPKFQAIKEKNDEV